MNPCSEANINQIVRQRGKSVTVKAEKLDQRLGWIGCSYPFASAADAETTAANLRTRSDYRNVRVVNCRGI